MRILIAGQTYYPALNGQAVFTVHLADGLARRGHEVAVVVPAITDDAGRAHRSSAAIVDAPSVALNRLHGDVFLTLSPGPTVRRAFDRLQPDVAHVQDHYPISRAVLAQAIRRRVRLVATNHFVPENLLPYVPGILRPRRLVNRALWRWALDALNRADWVTAPSDTATSILRANGLTAPASAISCGVDSGRFFCDPTIDRRVCRGRYGLDFDKTVFLFVGRVDGEKRLDVLLRALAQTDRDDIQLAVAGDGAARKQLMELARRLGLGTRARFLGFVPGAHLPELLNSVDVFVMPSEAELLSIATLEAMACGKPVLAAQALALPELVTPDVNGFLFRPGDAADALRCMRFLADHPERWAELGAASVERARSHHLENTIAHYEALYQVLTESPRRQMR